jgi:hypothetical protein
MRYVETHQNQGLVSIAHPAGAAPAAPPLWCSALKNRNQNRPEFKPKYEGRGQKYRTFSGPLINPCL